jgi:hypothetical protein
VEEVPEVLVRFLPLRFLFFRRLRLFWQLRHLPHPLVFLSPFSALLPDLPLRDLLTLPFRFTPFFLPLLDLFMFGIFPRCLAPLLLVAADIVLDLATHSVNETESRKIIYLAFRAAVYCC